MCLPPRLGSTRRLARDSRHALESNPPDVLDSVSLIPQPRMHPSHQTRPRIFLLAIAVAAAAVGWLLNYLFVADQSRAGWLALPVWLVAGAAVGWLAIRWRERSRDQRLAESRLNGIGAASTDAILRVDADGVVGGWSSARRRCTATRPTRSSAVHSRTCSEMTSRTASPKPSAKGSVWTRSGTAEP